MKSEWVIFGFSRMLLALLRSFFGSLSDPSARVHPGQRRQRAQSSFQICSEVSLRRRGPGVGLLEFLRRL